LGDLVDDIAERFQCDLVSVRAQFRHVMLDRFVKGESQMAGDGGKKLRMRVFVLHSPLRKEEHDAHNAGGAG